MASTRQILIDLATRHQVWVGRYAGTVFKQMLPFLNDIEKEVIKELKLTPTSPSKQRLNKLLTNIQGITAIVNKDMRKSSKALLRDLAHYEAEFTQKMLQKATKIDIETATPSLSQLNAAAFTSVVDVTPGIGSNKGTNVIGHLAHIGTAQSANVIKQIRLGFATGQSINKIAENIQNVSSVITKRQAYTTARTLVNHVATSARHEFYSVNDDLLDKYMLVATLDSRTSLICANLDGKLFSAKEFTGANRPPYHYNCRTTFVRLPKGSYNIGDDGLVPSRPARGIKNGKVDYQSVAPNTKYPTWFKDQPDAFKREVLGKTKFKLYKEGMSLDSFVDENFRPLTINQLRLIDKNLTFFEKAGL